MGSTFHAYRVWVRCAPVVGRVYGEVECVGGGVGEGEEGGRRRSEGVDPVHDALHALRAAHNAGVVPRQQRRQVQVAPRQLLALRENLLLGPLGRVSSAIS